MNRSPYLTRVVLPVAIVITTATTALPAMKIDTEQDETKVACAKQAQNEYSAQLRTLNAKIDAGTLPVASVEDILAKRRLEENYCSRVVKCLGYPPAARGVTFSRCLDDEHDEQKRRAK